jgi:hypothetical protein
MINSGNQHLGFSPQIPTLTPAEMRNQSTLDRLTTFLRSLVLIPGQGINVRRDGSAGTVVESTAQSVEVGQPGRGISLYKDGTTFCVGLPSLNITYIRAPYKYSGYPGTYINAVATQSGKKEFRFTGAYPTYVGIRPKEYTGLDYDDWVHSGADGEDADTQAARVTGAVSICRFLAKNSSTLSDIPVTATAMSDYPHWEYSQSDNKLSASEFLTFPLLAKRDIIYDSAGIYAGKFSQIDMTLAANTTYIIYYELPKEWYTTFSNGGQVFVSLKIQADWRADYFYVYAGSVATDANKRLTAMDGMLPLQEILKFTATNATATYQKTPAPTYGTVTTVGGIVTGAT